MNPLRLALIADGPSDKALISIVRWRLRSAWPSLAFGEIQFDLNRPLPERMRNVIRLHAPEILLVHRDAERERLEVRRREIPDAQIPTVRIVPVRMTEAWLLFDERAIRLGAGNPNGIEPLDLPSIGRLEALPDPKEALRREILKAMNVTGPRRTKRAERRIPAAVIEVAEAIDDYSPLLSLTAFSAFIDEFDAMIASVRPPVL